MTPDNTPHANTGRARRNARSSLREFVRSRDGTAAIEFALLAIPYFLIVFAIMANRHGPFSVGDSPIALWTSAAGVAAMAVQTAVQQHWLAPAAGAGFDCALDIEQADGGIVVQVSFGNDCNADAAARASLEQAVRRASPLPYAGFESVFQRRVHLVFKHSGH